MEFIKRAKKLEMTASGGFATADPSTRTSVVCVLLH